MGKKRIRIFSVSIICWIFLHTLPLFLHTIFWVVSFSSNFNPRFKKVYRTLKVTQLLRRGTFICIQSIWFALLESWRGLELSSLIGFLAVSSWGKGPVLCRSGHSLGMVRFPMYHQRVCMWVIRYGGLKSDPHGQDYGFNIAMNKSGYCVQRWHWVSKRSVLTGLLSE